MTHLIKDTFYKEKLLQVSLSSMSFAQEQNKIKESNKSPIPEEIIKKSLGTFSKTAAGPHYAYLSFIANKQDLTGLYGIERFLHLQHIDVSHNQIKSLKPLIALKHLITLKASNNRITKLTDLNRAVPLQLMEVDCSNNEIEIIPDLSKHRFLKYLNLSNNRIHMIDGVKNNQYLEVLKLNNNKIEKIENLDGMNLVELELFGNEINGLEGLTQLIHLRKLDLSQNYIKSLNGIVDLSSLREFRISNNKISKIKELTYLENLVYLSVLDLCYNSIQGRRYYRHQVLYKLPGLRSLDGVLIIPEDIVKAENLYGMDLEERKRIFKDLLPDEEFIDRRIHISELIEPETEDENDDQEFVDQYDKTGKQVKRQIKSMGSQGSLSEMYHSNKSLNERPDQQQRTYQ